MPHITLQQALNIAIEHRNAGDLHSAELVYRQILNHHPDQPDVLHRLGVMVVENGRTDEGIELIRRALSLSPADAECWSNLGLILIRLGRIEEAVAAFGHAARLRPGTTGDLCNLGIALQLSGRTQEAVVAYRKAMSNRASTSESERCAPTDWELHACDNLLALLHHDPANDAKAIFEDHNLWNRLYAAPFAASVQRHDNESSPDRRLKVGYSSAYLDSRPVGRFMSGLLANHDHGEFEVSCYSDVRNPDGMTARLRAYCDVWRDTASLSSEQLADLIRRDRIDILVDLGMHTRDNRVLVFARRPAPVQLTYLAYCSTTGLSTIDYRISDPYLDPDDSDQPYYSEQTVRLRSYWCYPPPTDAPEADACPTTSKYAPCTFGCMNDFSKVNRETLSMWAAVLRNIPESRLLMHAPTEQNRLYVQEAFGAAGVQPSRIEFVGTLPMAEYFRQYHQIDIALDPTPWCGGTTTCDALWMDVPVVSLACRTAISRGGLSILSQVGLRELVAQSPPEYVALASSLARDVPRLTEMRQGLRERMRRSRLMDAPGFAADFESTLRRCWRHWCAR
jgi:protein O-GlcNAc transferase